MGSHAQAPRPLVYAWRKEERGRKALFDRQAFEDIFSGIAPKVLYDEPLRNHTTWRIGGPADVMVIPTTVEQVKEAVRRAEEHVISWFVIGRGSNLLVKDGGLRGLVIKLSDDFADIDLAGTKLHALAGRGLVSAANIAIRHGLCGLEFATGIPGTIGGAVTMNAGAHGSEIKDVLKRATVLFPDGSVNELTPGDLHLAYRHSAVRKSRWIVLAAEFSLSVGDKDEMMERVRGWSKRRNSTQPLSMPSCGSVFRNPSGDHAARLIEATGLKGTRIGNAMVSDLHANFIVNVGDAEAADVLDLIRTVREAVKERFGVDLTPEVQVVGEER